MTALGKLIRTTAFKLTLVYLAVFVLFAASLLGYFALNTRRLITEQITSTVDGEIAGLTEQYAQGGIRRLVIVVDLRSRRPGSSLYLVTTPTGEGLAGNVGSLEPGVLDHPGWLETNYRRLEAPEGNDHRALVRVVQLPGGFHLLVGRDLDERERLFGIIAHAGQWSLALVIVLGLIGGFFVSRRVLKRIDAMTDTAQTIMRGDLAGRLPVAGTGDELDRLAEHLNAMLERIEALMGGLKEVSDNIAHDLKTPLTRLRNRCEQALRTATGEADYRAALEATIGESDELIRTFNALLMIARAESGQARDNMTEFDAAEIARDVGELYEPLAEEKGIALTIEAPAAAPVRGNRELVSQALANLVDNAIKYAGPDSKANGVPAAIVVRAGDDGERIVLSVEDRGPGIAEGDRERVVERFVRLEQSRSAPGSGLGLSLASAVARLHGGELKLEDNHPGLRSTIALPRADPAVTPATAGAAGERRGAGSGGGHLMKRPAVRAKPKASRPKVSKPKASRPNALGDKAALIRRLRGPLPVPVPAEAKPARLSAWLTSIQTTASGKALAALVRTHPALARLLAGIAEAAPFLWDLVQADSARLLHLVGGDPDAVIAALLAKTRKAAAAAATQAEVMRILRRMKADAALLIALADIGGVWPVARVTDALTDVAETALAAAVHYLLREAVAAKKIAPPAGKDPDAGSGFIVLAMGKMGGRELNYSSDIDLMVFFDAHADRLGPDVVPGAFYVKLTRGLVKLLQERTSDGYVFRVDLRLRPDPASTQIAISTAAALAYYESRGQNWERAALIKARPCAGDRAAGEHFMRDLAPFVWRKYLDYATIADVHEMKRRIHAYRGHGEIAVECHNIKLGRGGIREIEFFVQTQQLIAGGRHAELRGGGTVAMLAVLAHDGWVSALARDELTQAYEFLRRVEHRLQMMADEQTHTLPADADALEVFARFLGFADRDAFAAVLLSHLRKVEQHYIKLFEHAPDLVAERQNLSFAPGAEGDTLDRLAQMGFRRPQEAANAVRNWQAGRYRALRGEQARGNLLALVPVILDQFSRAESPDAAVAAFDRFLGGLRAGGRFFSLLRQNPELIRFVTLILGVAPRLADILAHHPHLIDPLLDPSFFGALPDESRLEAELAGVLGEARDYEEALDAIRLFGQEHMFLIGARILSGSLSAEQAGEVFARLADVLLRAVHKRAEADFAAAHGRIRGGESAILALGRLGAREMTASSDLDLIVIYDFDQRQPDSDGKRPLHGVQYFARLTQRLISALTVQTNYGVLYPVDMRLRPSGRSGPVATQIEGFQSYQESRAWTWEHMALTRARVVSGRPDFAARIEAVIRGTLCRPRIASAIARDVVEMRAAIAKEKGETNPWDLKYAAGGLIDIEFIVQYLQLVHAKALPDILDTSTTRVLDKALHLGVLKPEHAEVLRPAVRLFHDLTQILRLCLPTVFDPKTANAGVLGLLARAADLPDFAALQAHVEDTQRQVRACFVRILGAAG